jgi:hypothetical protein
LSPPPQAPDLTGKLCKKDAKSGKSLVEEERKNPPLHGNQIERPSRQKFLRIILQTVLARSLQGLASRAVLEDKQQLEWHKKVNAFLSISKPE